MYKLLLKFLVCRLQEASTWRGILVALTGAGVLISPKYQNLIITIGVILFGGAHFMPDDMGDQTNGQCGNTGTTGTGSGDAGSPQPFVSPKS